MVPGGGFATPPARTRVRGSADAALPMPSHGRPKWTGGLKRRRAQRSPLRSTGGSGASSYDVKLLRVTQPDPNAEQPSESKRERSFGAGMRLSLRVDTEARVVLLRNVPGRRGLRFEAALIADAFLFARHADNDHRTAACESSESSESSFALRLITGLQLVLRSATSEEIVSSLLSVVGSRPALGPAALDPDCTGSEPRRGRKRGRRSPLVSFYPAKSSANVAEARAREEAAAASRLQEKQVRIFPRQAMAFAFADDMAPDAARLFAQGWPRPFVFCCEDKTSGRRQYGVAGRDSFIRWYLALGTLHRHVYEVIREDAPCKLYFDLEFPTGLMAVQVGADSEGSDRPEARKQVRKRRNAGLDGEALVDCVVRTASTLLFRLFGVFVDRREHIIDLDSSTSVKFSRHLVFTLPGGAVFADNRACGRFVRLVHAQARDELVVVTRSGETASFIDLGVYTRNRTFRLWLASKHGGSATLQRSARPEFVPLEDDSAADVLKSLEATLVCPVTPATDRGVAGKTGAAEGVGSADAVKGGRAGALKILRHSALEVLPPRRPASGATTVSGSGPAGVSSGLAGLAGSAVSGLGAGLGRLASAPVSPFPRLERAMLLCADRAAGVAAGASRAAVRAWTLSKTPVPVAAAHAAAEAAAEAGAEAGARAGTGAGAGAGAGAEPGAEPGAGTKPGAGTEPGRGPGAWEPERLTLQLCHNRFCHRIGRQHKSNNVLLVFDFATKTLVQRCHDADCSGFVSAPLECHWQCDDLEEGSKLRFNNVQV